MADKTGVCALCGYVGKLTVHHSVWPRRSWAPKIRQRYIVNVCRECHDIIHDSIEPRFCMSRYRKFILREGGDNDGV